jgi:uncharacterized membrane protein (DUF106 family)
MLRAFGIFGLGIVFLMISPKLRDQVQSVIGVGVTTMDTYAPYSYAAGVIAVLVTLIVSFNRGSQAR